MRAIKVTYNDGHDEVTSINGTMEEIRAYFIGQWFNFGDNDWGQPDRMLKAIAVEEVA